MKKLLDKTSDYTEKSLIGSLLLDNGHIASVFEYLSPEHFTFKDLGSVYSEIIRQWQRGGTVDAGTVSGALPPALDDVPFDCQGGVGSAVNAPVHAKKICDAAKRREIASACSSITQMARTDEREVSDVIGDAQTLMLGIEHRQEAASIVDDMVEIRKDSEAASLTKDLTIGVPTHFKTFDEVTGGLRKQNMVVIASRPSVGKTTFLGNVFHKLVVDGAERAGFFSAEMSRKEILIRMISGESGIDSNYLTRGNLRKDEWVKYTETQSRLALKMEGRVFIDDRAGMTPQHIRAIAKQQQQNGGLDIIFIDYLQLLKMHGNFSSTPDRLTAISHGVKEMAKDLNIPVVIAAQLGRAAEERGPMKRPVLTDLKGSGSIEEDADVVALIHREYRQSVDAQVIIAKHRNGPLGDFSATFHGPTTMFTEV